MTKYLPHRELMSHRADIEEDVTERRERGEPMRQRAEIAIGDGVRELDIVASTEDIDSYGTILRGWDLTRYLKNPVVLWAHQGDSVPIGQAVNCRVVGTRLVATVSLLDAETSPRAEEAYRAAKAGALRGVSVGFYPNAVEVEKHRGEEVVVLKDNELREISLCAVPSNPNALVVETRSDARSGAIGEERDNEVNPLQRAMDAAEPPCADILDRRQGERFMRERREREATEDLDSLSNPLRRALYRNEMNGSLMDALDGDG